MGAVDTLPAFLAETDAVDAVAVVVARWMRTINCFKFNQNTVITYSAVIYN